MKNKYSIQIAICDDDEGDLMCEEFLSVETPMKSKALLDTILKQIQEAMDDGAFEP